MTLLDKLSYMSFKKQIFFGTIVLQLLVVSLFTYEFISRQRENLEEHLTE